MPIPPPSADANTPVPDPSSTLMEVLLAEWRGLSLTLTLGNACRFPDAVSVVGPLCRRRWRRRYVNSRNIPIARNGQRSKRIDAHLVTTVITLLVSRRSQSSV